MEEQLRRRDLKSMEVEETRKVESQCIRDEDGRLVRDKNLITQRWARFFQSLLNAKTEKLGPDITSRLPQQTMEAMFGVEPTEDSTRAPSDGEFQNSGKGRTYS